MQRTITAIKRHWFPIFRSLFEDCKDHDVQTLLELNGDRLQDLKFSEINDEIIQILNYLQDRSFIEILRPKDTHRYTYRGNQFKNSRFKFTKKGIDELLPDIPRNNEITEKNTVRNDISITNFQGIIGNNGVLDSPIQNVSSSSKNYFWEIILALITLAGVVISILFKMN